MGLVHRALERSVKVLPIVLSPCLWDVSLLGGLKPLPANGNPVTAASDRAAAWLDVVQGIVAVLDLAGTARHAHLAPVAAQIPGPREHLAAARRRHDSISSSLVAQEGRPSVSSINKLFRMLGLEKTPERLRMESIANRTFLGISITIGTLICIMYGFGPALGWAILYAPMAAIFAGLFARDRVKKEMVTQEDRAHFLRRLALINDLINLIDEADQGERISIKQEISKELTDMIIRLGDPRIVDLIRRDRSIQNLLRTMEMGLASHQLQISQAVDLLQAARFH